MEYVRNVNDYFKTVDGFKLLGEDKGDEGELHDDVSLKDFKGSKAFDIPKSN